MKRSNLKRNASLRKRSKKQQARMLLLKKEYERVFATNPACVWCGRAGATSPHHTTEKRRNADGLFFWIPVHEIPCHQDIHGNRKREAIERGFLDCDWSDRFRLMVHKPNPDYLFDESD